MSKIIEINAQTNEIIEREPTAAEIIDFEQNKQNYNVRINAQAEAETAKAAATAKLAALGLTEDDLKALGL